MRGLSPPLDVYNRSCTFKGGDVFMNFTLLSAMEFPGYGISYFGMQFWGRKVSSWVCNIIFILDSYFNHKGERIFQCSTGTLWENIVQ